MVGEKNAVSKRKKEKAEGQINGKV